VMSDVIGDMGPLMRPIASLVARLERAAIRDAAGVLAVCPALADYAREAAPDGHIGVLPDTPLPDDGAYGGPSELEQVAGTKILYVGNLEPYQGVPLLLDAFRLAAPDCPDATLFIIGGREEHIREHARRVPDLVRTQRVRFLGERPLEELGQHLAAADVLASPRRSGVNTPLKIYSYMQAGKAILATRQQTHTQVLDDSTAYLADPDPASMAAGIRALAASESLRESLGAAARERVEAEYSFARFGERLHSFYGDLPLTGGLVAAG
jgi:glycosyltransferase involved in cell wall biosynthesis